MKNLNSKKARQEIATLYNIIIVSGREISDFLFCDRPNGIEEHYRINGAKYYETKSLYQESIIKLVEVYGIPHILYDDVVKDKKRDDEEAA